MLPGRLIGSHLILAGHVGIVFVYTSTENQEAFPVYNDSCHLRHP